MSLWRRNVCQMSQALEYKLSKTQFSYYKFCHEKTCLRDLQPGKTQTGLRTHRD